MFHSPHIICSPNKCRSLVILLISFTKVGYQSKRYGRIRGQWSAFYGTIGFHGTSKGYGGATVNRVSESGRSRTGNEKGWKVSVNNRSEVFDTTRSVLFAFILTLVTSNTRLMVATYTTLARFFPSTFPLSSSHATSHRRYNQSVPDPVRVITW